MSTEQSPVYIVVSLDASSQLRHRVCLSKEEADAASGEYAAYVITVHGDFEIRDRT